MECINNHFTFDKGESDCEGFLQYLMTVERVFLFPYITEAGVSYSEVSQVVEPQCSMINCGFLKEHPDLIYVSSSSQVSFLFRADCYTGKGLLVSVATFCTRDGEICKPFSLCLFPKVKTKKLCTKSMHIVLYCIEYNFCFLITCLR